MKYKKQIATGALTLSLLINGSAVFADTPIDISTKKSHTYIQNHKNKNLNGNIQFKKRKNIVGTIISINNSGFILEVHNKKNKIIKSLDIIIKSKISYIKNGVKAHKEDIKIGKRVIVFGFLDRSANVVIPDKIKII